MTSQEILNELERAAMLFRSQTEFVVCVEEKRVVVKTTGNLEIVEFVPVTFSFSSGDLRQFVRDIRAIQNPVKP
jgi:hypothetical protein